MGASIMYCVISGCFLLVKKCILQTACMLGCRNFAEDARSFWVAQQVHYARTNLRTKDVAAE